MPGMNAQSIHRRFYDLPAVVPADRPTEIVVRPLFEHSRFRPRGSYRIRHLAMERQSDADRKAETAVRPDARGALRFTLRFAGEQEHVLRIGATVSGEKVTVASFRLYSLHEDLLERRPLKGDLHTHSCRSDGVEEPAYVAAAARREGLDFVALTDHSRYDASLEAMEAFAGVDTDFRIYPGEEIHPPGNPIHMLNVGGRSSVVELFRRQPARYRTEVAAIRKGLAGLPEGVDAAQYASCLWTFQKTREAGGLAVFCHPYWYWDDHFMAPGALTDHLLAERPFDAVEVITSLNSVHTRTNMMENTYHTARYYEECGRGGPIPAIGVSDAHRVEGASDFGRCYTVVFPQSPEAADVIDSIRRGFSVAVENLPGLGARPHGPFRLVKLTHFLIREVFPAHDEICREEGQRLLAHIARGGGAAATSWRRPEAPRHRRRKPG